MIYNKQCYDNLRKGFPMDDDFSFSKTMKVDMENNRMEMLADVIDYLEENKIKYENVNYDVVFNDFTIQPNMKVFFNGSKKGYQYNYQKCIDLINKRVLNK